MYEYRCKVVKVVDGDTVDCDIDLGLWTRRQERVRLLGINAPEVTGPEAERGKLATTALQAKVVGKTLTVKTVLDKGDKYGRLLGVFYDGDENLNEWMVAHGYAVPYMTDLKGAA